MAEIQLRDLWKYYDDVAAVRGINLDIEHNEFIALVGPSGCGKTTTLRMIAGLEDITAGDILVGERIINEVAPKDRDIAMVFQNYALYPHMSVYQNMSFGLRLRKTPKDEIDDRVRAAADILNIGELLDRRPKQLSGGQRQRVAMGRAIVREPQVFRRLHRTRPREKGHPTKQTLAHTQGQMRPRPPPHRHRSSSRQPPRGLPNPRHPYEEISA